MIILPRSPAQTTAELAAGFATGNAIHLINYHATPSTRREEYRQQIAACAERYVSMGLTGVDGLMTPTGDKPVLAPILFEGFRDNYDVILPILEEFGFKGWFFIPSHFPNVPPARQRIFAARHNLHYGPDEYAGDRIAMTWGELRDAHARGHFMACHSRNHIALHPDTPDDILHDEIVTAKQEMEDGLGVQVDTFCYLYGAEYGLNLRADAMLIDAGYRYLFSNFRLQKLQ